MARGWQSKSVESQVEDARKGSAGEGEPAKEGKPANEEERQRQRKMNSLLLSRTRLVNELQNCSNARFKGQLEQELAYVDHELAKLNSV